MLRAIQTAEKLHRTLSDTAFAPETPPETQEPEEDENLYAYDHTNMHKQLAEMSDEDLLSHVEELVGDIERKSFTEIARALRSGDGGADPFSRLGETVPAPPKARKKWRH